MEAAPLDYDLESEIRRFQAARAGKRTKGRHLSEVLHYILKKKEPKRFAGGAIEALAVHQGFIWEDIFDEVLGQQLGSGLQRELLEDGIYMTPDGMDFDRWRIREFKSTKLSAGHPIRGAKFWHWHVQIGCYCRAMATREAELIVLHINGSYELGGGRFGKTVAKPWLLRWTRRELEDYWRMILKARDQMDEEGL